jgi:hypothetical protein
MVHVFTIYADAGKHSSLIFIPPQLKNKYEADYKKA